MLLQGGCGYPNFLPSLHGRLRPAIRHVGQSVPSDRPPYDIDDIERKSEDQDRITMAVAGFGSNEIELVQHGSTLLVTGQKGEHQGAQMLHQGIASSSFRQSFNLADHVKVVGANLEHGLLAIDLVREVPEQLKPRRIEIGSVGGTRGSASKARSGSKSIKTLRVNAKPPDRRLENCGPASRPPAGRSRQRLPSAK
jgi:molecular chaperone IbpA